MMANELFGVSAQDPLTFARRLCAFGYCVRGRMLHPARRAMRVDPMLALRFE